MPEAKPLVSNSSNKLPLQTPLLSSAKASWDKIYLESHCQTSGEVPACYAKQHTLCIYTSGRQRRSERWLYERFHTQCMGELGEYVTNLCTNYSAAALLQFPVYVFQINLMVS